MARPVFLSALVLAALTIASAAFADGPVKLPDSAPGGLQAGAAVPGALTPAPPASIYGPIHSHDPLVRAQIKHLYQQLSDDQTAARDAIRDLNQQLGVTSDPDFRFELSHKLAAAKAGMEHRRMELGLQIAQLDQDAPRIAEYTLALDQMDHPEKYRPQYVPDPANARPAPTTPHN